VNSSSAIPREGLKRLYNHLVVNLVIAFGGEASMLLLGRIGRGNVAAVIFFAGAVGATLNTYYRLSKLAAIPASELNLDPIDEKLMSLQMYVSTLVGGILAILMYGLCFSGLVEGALFPKFKSAAEQAEYENLQVFLGQLRPATTVDAAKAVIWSFISGFSERLIPNLLDRFVARATSER